MTTTPEMRHADVSKKTAQFLLELVNAQTLTIGAPDFDEAVASVLHARAELQAILATTDPPEPSA